MAKASLKLPSGTVLTIEGSPEEVQHLLSIYEQQPEQRPSTALASGSTRVPDQESLSLATIVNGIKSCDNATAIDKHILAGNSQLKRVLLPLYVIHEQFSNKMGLTSGDINKILKDLGCPVSLSNVSSTLSGPASRFVIADQIRRKGLPIRYKIHRRGVDFLRSALQEHADATTP